jgi:hypothetical protein
MWTRRATAAGSTAIICITIMKTAACPSLSSARVWESASWRSVSATTGAATTEAGPGTVERATGCIGRRRRGVHGLRFVLRHRRGPIPHRGRNRRRGRDRRWIDPRRADPDLRTAGALRGLRPGRRRAPRPSLRRGHRRDRLRSPAPRRRRISARPASAISRRQGRAEDRRKPATSPLQVLGGNKHSTHPARRETCYT